jgi:hypothetical protein
MKRSFILFISGVFFNSGVFAQTGTPAILNVTGGCSVLINNLYYFDWSIGEETMLETTHFGPAYITHGVLQPEYPNPNTDQHWGKFELIVYPNPATDWIILEFSSYQIGPVYLSLFDESGKLMYYEKFFYSGGPYTKKVNVSGFASGAYFLNVEMPQTATSIYKNSTYKIIKAK